MHEDPFLLLKHTDAMPDTISIAEEIPLLKGRNKVVWENKSIQSEFSQKIDTECQLGLLLRFESDKMRAEGDVSTLRRGHNRAADLRPKNKVVDENGRVYGDIDMKGVGWYSRVTGHIKPWESDSDKEHVAGLCDEKWAIYDAERAEEFTALGIRTHRSLGVMRLLEVPVQEKSGSVGLVPVSAIPRGKPEKPTHGILLPEFVPAVEIRAFGIKTRVEEVVSPLGRYGPELTLSQLKERRARIGEAIAYVHNEDDNVVNTQSYAFWFARTLGTNIGRMHAVGYTHGALTRHNVTLDCSITDLDTVEKFDLSEKDLSKYNELVAKDRSEVEKTLKAFLEELDRLYPERMIEAALREFTSSYQDASGKTSPTVAFPE